MKNLTLKSGNEQEFFRRGKVLAPLADAGQPISEERRVSFEDPADLLRLQTARAGSTAARMPRLHPMSSRFDNDQI
jgi:hypothetical protein